MRILFIISYQYIKVIRSNLLRVKSNKLSCSNMVSYLRKKRLRYKICILQCIFNSQTSLFIKYAIRADNVQCLFSITNAVSSPIDVPSMHLLKLLCLLNVCVSKQHQAALSSRINQRKLVLCLSTFYVHTITHIFKI